jgi:stage II sporulation protein AA (anti-sigma F factor antagonist)
MESRYEKEDKQLIFEINEDIDECYVQKIRRRLDNEIERYMPKEIIFDFSKVSFMDSAGIGLLIGRYKLANMLGGEVKIANINTPVRKIFEMSGIFKIIPEVKIDLVKNSNKKEPDKTYGEVQYE